MLVFTARIEEEVVMAGVSYIEHIMPRSVAAACVVPS